MGPHQIQRWQQLDSSPSLVKHLGVSPQAYISTTAWPKKPLLPNSVECWGSALEAPTTGCQYLPFAQVSTAVSAAKMGK